MALALPVFLLVVLVGLDFGRLFMSWVMLQQGSRIAANFASVHPAAWGDPGVPLDRENYQRQITQDLAPIDCDFPDPAPDPSFPDGTDIGMPAVVELTCQFHMATPIIEALLPSPLSISALSSFPIRVGFTSHTPGGGGGEPQSIIGTIPSNATVTSGQNLQFLDSSNNHPTAWTWDFGDGSTLGCDGTADVTSWEFPCHTYWNPGTTSIQVRAWLTACNPSGCSVASVLITVKSATPVPDACFTMSPSPGLTQQTITFTDCSTENPTAWQWNFGDGAVINIPPSNCVTTSPCTVNHVYTSPGTQSCSPASGSDCYLVTLVATNQYGSSTISHLLSISSSGWCSSVPVPNFVNGTFLPIPHNGKWTKADVAAEWAATPYSGGSINYQNGIPGDNKRFNVTQQTPAGGSHPTTCNPPLSLWWS